MNRIAAVLATFFYIILLGNGCKERERAPNISVSEAKKRLNDINKGLVEKDREKIEAYIERHRLEGVEQNQAGLFYLVWGEATGPKVKSGDIVVFDFKITLLDGTLCYSSENDNPKNFLVGYGNVESGLEMGMLLMHQGQRAKFILPPHLNHGLLGDGNMIPPRSIIVYDVHLLTIIEN